MVLYDRSSLQYKAWTGAVKLRDEFVCKICGSTTNLHAHHCYSISDFPDQMWELNNGITMCDKCHKMFHSKYGHKDISHETIQKFKNFRAKQTTINVKNEEPQEKSKWGVRYTYQFLNHHLWFAKAVECMIKDGDLFLFFFLCLAYLFIRFVDAHLPG